MTKLCLGFLVISLAAFALGNNDFDNGESDGGCSAQLDSYEGTRMLAELPLYECQPGDRLQFFDGEHCSQRRYKGCQVWIGGDTSKIAAGTCKNAIFEESYVNIHGVESAKNAFFVRSIVEVYDAVEETQGSQALDAVSIDSIVSCYPATKTLDESSNKYSCRNMAFTGKSAFNVPSGVIYKDTSSRGEFSEHYTFCDAGPETPECTKYLRYVQGTDTDYNVTTADFSCCVPSPEDDRLCARGVQLCGKEDLNFCSHESAVSGAPQTLHVPGRFGEKFGFLLSCIILSDNDNDYCYTNSCRHDDGCGDEWDFSSLINDTMAPELQGVRNAWRDVLYTVVNSETGDYVRYCRDLDNECNEFGEDSFQCYKTRATGILPGSANDPRPHIDYTEINLELKLKAHQKSQYIQDWNGGGVELKDQRYLWKQVTLEIMEVFLKAVGMLRSINDEDTVVKGKELMNDVDATLQALIVVAQMNADEYTSYHGALLQIMSLVRGYSIQTAPTTTSGLLLPMYTSDIIIDQFVWMISNMAYESADAKLDQVLSQINQTTIMLLNTTAQTLSGNMNTAHTEIDLAQSEMERSVAQITNAKNHAEEMYGRLNSNYKRLQSAMEAYVVQKKREYAVNAAFSIASFVTGSFGNLIEVGEKFLKNSTDNWTRCFALMKTLGVAFDAVDKWATVAWDNTGFDYKIPMPDPAEPDWQQEGSTANYVDNVQLERYKQMALDTHKAVKDCTPATFDEYLHSIQSEMVNYLNHEDGAVASAANKLLLDVKTGTRYNQDAYESSIAFAQAAGRAAVATSQLVGNKQVISNIERLNNDLENPEEQALVSIVAAVHVLIGALSSADYVSQLCSSHLYANGASMDSRIARDCKENSIGPTPQLWRDLLSNTATLHDITKAAIAAVDTFKAYPDLFKRDVSLVNNYYAYGLNFYNDVNDVQGLGLSFDSYFEGKPTSFSLYKGSPLLEGTGGVFVFNNPMLLGYYVIAEGLNIMSKTVSFQHRLDFDRVFKVYNGTTEVLFLKPQSKDWGPSAMRPIAPGESTYCKQQTVDSPWSNEGSGMIYCPMASIQPSAPQDPVFAFDSIYTRYQLTFLNPEILEPMTEEEKANVKIEITLWYQSTSGETALNNTNREARMLWAENLSAKKPKNFAGMVKYYERVEDADGHTSMRRAPLPKEIA